MKTAIIGASALGALCVLALAACEKGKPRHVPYDPMAVAPPPAAAAPLSAGLAKREEAAAFSIDRIGASSDPLNHQPAETPAAQPIVVEGFGFDMVSKTPGRGVDLVVDGKPYGTTYGADRPDVARFFKTSGLTAVGFTTTLPAGALPPGPHMAVVRVVAADGKGYFDGRSIAFQVK